MAVIENGWCFFPWSSKGITEKMPEPWLPPRGKLKKKAVFSPHCGDETARNYNRAFSIRCRRLYRILSKEIASFLFFKRDVDHHVFSFQRFSTTTQHYMINSVNSICKDDRAYGALYRMHWIHDKIFIPIYSKSKELSFHSKNRFFFFQKEICWTFQHIICLIPLNWSQMNRLPMIIIPINLFLFFLYLIILLKNSK